MNNESDDVISNSVNQIMVGSSVIFAGALIGSFFDVLIKRTLTSYLSPADFGIYALALTIMSMIGVIATLGLTDGVPRYIAFFRGKNEEYKIHELLISAIVMGVIASIITMLLSPFVFDHLVAKGFDGRNQILAVIRIMVFAIPFTILLNLATSVYRGFDRMSVNMYFYNIIRPVSLIIFITIAVSLDLSLHGVVLFDLISMIFTFGVMSVYYIKNPPFKAKLQLRFGKPTKQLIRYSLPLLITATLLNLMTWTDTIMLGYFKSTEVVGIYSAVYPLVGFLSMLIGSMGYAYIPVIAKLYGENKVQLISSIYQITTKWCFLLTFPIFALMFVYPETLLTRVYEAHYVAGAPVLRILALGFITNSYFGFNYHTIMASGNSDLLMNCSFASAIMNVLLNFMLVPQYGMMGAAVASSVSFAAIEVFMTLKTWKQENIHPFTIAYKRLTMVCVFLVVTMLIIKSMFSITGTWLECTAFILVYFAIIRYANILDKNEIEILSNSLSDIHDNASNKIATLMP